MPKITVYIPTHDYGHFIEQAIQSVFSQTLEDWELIIINDGSTDHTANLLTSYKTHPKVRVIEQVKRGLNVSNNVALRLANAPYVMRLDADDYLDENALLVLSSTLDKKPEVGLVYPDYYLVNSSGDILELVRRKKIGEEAELLDLPAHGACTMIRRDCLLQLEGYSEEFSCQDGYDLWLRFLTSFKPYNVNIPLFYYRQHAQSLTSGAGNPEKILHTKASIEKKFIEKFQKNMQNVLAIVPIVKESAATPGSAFCMLSDRPLLWHSLQEIIHAKGLSQIVVTSNDEEVLNYSKEFHVKTIKRSEDLSRPGTTVQDIVQDALQKLKEEDHTKPSAVMILPVNTPFRKKSHIERAIYTMTIFDVDTVISVTEELAHCYVHEKYGLVPLQKNRELRIEKKALYKETGALLLSRLDRKTNKYFLGEKIGHVMMLPQESIKIKSHFDLWLAQQMMEKNK